MASSIFDTIRSVLSDLTCVDNLINVRSSSKAKRLIFTSSVQKGIEIIVPDNADIKWTTRKVADRIEWIKMAQQRIKQKREQLHPRKVNLRALNETWSIEHVSVGQVTNRLMINGDYSLKIIADPRDVFYPARKLQEWFHQKAKTSLIPWLISLARDRRLSFNNTYVRNQVSRWGSCSEKRNISLNRNLLFIPKHLVEYVLHHELTHLNHLNHSRLFWSSFKSVLPHCLELRAELRSLNDNIEPFWASRTTINQL